MNPARRGRRLAFPEIRDLQATVKAGSKQESPMDYCLTRELVWLARETRDNPLGETRKSSVVLFERARDENGPFLKLIEEGEEA